MDTIVRVEIFGSPTAAQYAALHLRMKSVGFSTTIKATDGYTYHLPSATYCSTSYPGAVAARDAAWSAAHGVAADYSVTASEYPTAFRNLRRV